MTNSTNGSNTKESKNYWMDDNKNYRMDDSMLIQIASILARTGAARLYLSDDQLAFLSHFVTHLPDFLAFIQNPTDFGSNHNLPDTLPTDNSTDFFIELAYLIHFMVMDQFLPQLLDPQLQSSILPSLSLLPSIQDLDVDSFDQPIPDSFYNAYLPVDSIFYTLENDADLIPFLHTYEVCSSN
ncbi:hypothetical protein BC833DRAFT_605619 [Globomyces pollinis-pini]|nr:hypothetical protein BC833DRAFT_605619 [Globomyces pollinis-pini]